MRLLKSNQSKNHQSDTAQAKLIRLSLFFRCYISTQSDSNNIDTVQIYVAYAHTTVKATFDWEVSLDFDKIGMSISFIPQPRTTIIAEGHATFWYNSQDFEVAPNV